MVETGHATRSQHDEAGWIETSLSVTLVFVRVSLILSRVDIIEIVIQVQM